MVVPSSPKVIDLSTPLKDRKAKSNRPGLPPPLPCGSNSTTLGPTPNTSVGCSVEDSDCEDIDVEESPRLPSDWVPFEYELLEYADSLPKGFVDGVRRMLQAQQRQVAQLRSLNTLMLNVLQGDVVDSLEVEAAAETACCDDVKSGFQTPKQSHKLATETSLFGWNIESEHTQASSQHEEQAETNSEAPQLGKLLEKSNGIFSWEPPDVELNTQSEPAKQVSDASVVAKSAMTSCSEVNKVQQPSPSWLRSAPTLSVECLAETSPVTRSGGWTPTEEVAKRLESAARARRLEAKVLEVRRAAEKELLELASRARAAEEKHRKLSREAAGDDASSKKRLYEAEAKMQRLANRVQQLELTKRNAERRRTNGEQQDRQLQATLAELREEVRASRSRVKDFDDLERQEDDLRRVLRLKKSELRSMTTREKAAAAMTAIEAAAQMPQASGTLSPRRVASPMRRCDDGRTGLSQPPSPGPRATTPMASPMLTTRGTRTILCPSRRPS